MKQVEFIYIVVELVTRVFMKLSISFHNAISYLLYLPPPLASMTRALSLPTKITSALSLKIGYSKITG